MKRINTKRWIIFGFIISLTISCDTERNIVPRDDSHFLKVYGGEGDQEGVDMIVKADGTFILFGTTRLPGKTSQLYLVKADAQGKVIWERTFGGPFDEEARDLDTTRTGGIVIVGNTKTVGGDRDIMIMTLSADGAKIDSSGYSLNSATTKLDEVANSVTETADGFIVAGYTNNVKPKPQPPFVPPDLKDALYVRFLNNPLQVYPNTWVAFGGSESSDETTKIIEVSNGFYMFGFTNNTSVAPFTYDFWYFGIGNGGVSTGDIKVKYLGNQIGSKAIANPNAGGFALIGSSINSNGDSSIFMVKLRSPLTFTESAGGDLESIQLISSTSSLAGASIYASKYSGYLVLADQRTGGGNSDIFLSRVGNSLIQEWTLPTSLVFGGACEDIAGAVAELPDGHIMIVGTIRTGDECESKMALIKVNKDGKFEE